jgi:hypothetical protein
MTVRTKGIALAASLAVLPLLAACQQHPPGSCDVHLDCQPGQECTTGVCVRLETTHQLGARCIRASDCVAWADCISEVCSLASGRCGWDGDCSPWEGCNASHACATRPNGCPDDSGCASWQSCVSYQCRTAAGRCASNVDCAAWETCGGTHACALMPGACGTDVDCAGWQACVAHACALPPGRCSTGTDCQSWQTCDGTHTCALTPGKCGTGADCATWQSCDGTHTCVLAAGRCLTGADCAAWQTCDGTSTCVVAAGRCGTAADCQAWETCDGTNTCVVGAGRCGSSADCPGWKGCSVGHTCELLPGRCDGHADCASWQFCGADRSCAAQGGTCTVSPDCTAWQACAGGHCVNQAGRCGTSPECDPAWQVCGAGNVCLAGPGHCATSASCPAWQNCTPEHACGAAKACVADIECDVGETCSNGFCTAAVTVAADEIFLFGSAKPGQSYWEAMAPLRSPSHVTPGFYRPQQHQSAKTAYIDSHGDMLYVEFNDGIYQLRRWVPDSWDWLYGQWYHPADPLSNDPIIPTPACVRGPWMYDWQLRPETDDILYECNPPTGSLDLNYYDTAGNLRVSGYYLMAWRADGKLLGLRGESSGRTEVYVLDPDAGVTTHLALPSEVDTLFWNVKIAKPHADGFWFVMEKYPDVQNVRLFVDGSGVVTYEGTYAEPGGHAGNHWDWQQLDSTGAAYAFGYGAEVIYRCQLAPDGCTVVLDDADAPPLDRTATPPQTWCYLFGGQLVSRP